MRVFGHPHLYDKLGFPYWLNKDENLSEGWSDWLVISGKRKNNWAVIIKLFWDEQTFSLADLNVLDGYRNRGLGTQMLVKIKERSDSLGLKPVAREITPSNGWTYEDLANWYRSYGFEVEIKQK